MQINLPVNQLYLPDYEAEKSRCVDFITTFEDPALEEDTVHQKLKYMILLQAVANKESHIIQISVEDIKSHFTAAKDRGFVERVMVNTHRYVSLISEVIDDHMPAPTINFREEDLTTREVIMNQRKFNFQQARQQAAANGMQREGDQSAKGQIPAELERNYQLTITPGEFEKKNIVKMRDIKASQIGALVTMKGIVTRATDVRPCIKVAVFACDACGSEVYQVVNSKEFNPQVECPSQKCVKNQVRGQLVLQVKSSKFIPYQEIKIQEPSDQVPIGHVPRTMKIIAKNHLTRLCSAGDILTVTGIFLPSAMLGLRQKGLTQDTYLEAFQITKDKANYKGAYVSEDIMEQVGDVRGTCESDSHLLERLSKSICPEIFGMYEVKKALLLLMVSGVTKEMADGMKIRGNVNVLLMGDPGVAKSQLLKHTANFAPRGIYTTGKGSSGVGLTAAVVKDQVTGELLLEGGALVLADTGICCIDEFDKMDERDRTNIHEVMEQQTVSIAKAGITTSLNARTSVLAAANPVYGRYDPSKNPHDNINLPAALLSRFDLIFLLLDKANVELDQELARHVTNVHRTLKAPGADVNDGLKVSDDIMRAFLTHAQEYHPIIPPMLHNYIVAKYVEKRKFQREGNVEESYMYVTPRTLLAIIRLSQAMAKLSFRHQVEQHDVDEALKLMDFSIRSLRTLTGSDRSRREERRNQQEQDETTKLIQKVREIWSANSAGKYMPINDLVRRIRKTAGVDTDANRMTELLQYYQELNVINIDNDDQFVFL